MTTPTEPMNAAYLNDLILSGGGDAETAELIEQGDMAAMGYRDYNAVSVPELAFRVECLEMQIGQLALVVEMHNQRLMRLENGRE